MTPPQTISNLKSSRYVIGVDVGTGSARAGLFDMDGQILTVAKRDISLFREAGGLVEQSSAEIWDAVCSVVRETVVTSTIDPALIIGIGFDATCSLVVLGEDGHSLPVGPSEDANRDIIVWMDHRAVDQAERINAMGHDVLRYVGGRISPEMETPKILWLKENRPEIFDAAWQFFDLADFLTWKASGDLSRSTCTVTCKWTYLAHEQRWDPGYFKKIGLGILADEDFSRIGTNIVEPGTRLGQGLTSEAALAMGLMPGTAVAAGMIDAHAGGIGTVGIMDGAESNLAYVFGTSSCTMTSTEQPVFVPGVWGPYFSAMVPGMWLNEGGQSAAGSAIDHLLSFHPAVSAARTEATMLGTSLPVFIANAAKSRVGSASSAVFLAKGLHIVPEFLGNRAPFADPHARGVIAGLGMEQDFESLIGFYIAGLCGIGYGLRQIIDAQSEAGAHIKRIVVSGGAAQHDLVRQILADACGTQVVATRSDEPVLLGSAILGAVSSGTFADIASAMKRMSQAQHIYNPLAGDIANTHTKRYQSFQMLQEQARLLRTH